MKEKEFNKLAREHFGAVLEPYGFSTEKSHHCTFYKAVGDLYHVIMPDLSGDGTSFIIRVFVTSSLIDPRFDERFPDYVGIPSGVCSSLHPRFGVNFRDHNYRCRLEEGFIRNFNKDAKPALLDKGIPYLENINNLQDMLPYIKSPFYMGVTLWRVGEKDKARPILEEELQRLSVLKDDTGNVTKSLKFIENILSDN
jgi:hypothetical protein